MSDHTDPRPRHLSLNPHAKKKSRIKDLRLALEDMGCECRDEHLDVLDALVAENEELRGALTDVLTAAQHPNWDYGEKVHACEEFAENALMPWSERKS